MFARQKLELPARKLNLLVEQSESGLADNEMLTNGGRKLFPLLPR